MRPSKSEDFFLFSFFAGSESTAHCVGKGRTCDFYSPHSMTLATCNSSVEEQTSDMVDGCMKA